MVHARSWPRLQSNRDPEPSAADLAAAVGQSLHILSHVVLGEAALTFKSEKAP